MTKKISVDAKTSKKEVVSRRKFMKGAAVAGVAAAGTLGVPNIPKAATVLKVQAAWGGGIFLENAKSYVDRVNKMAGGGLKGGVVHGATDEIGFHAVEDRHYVTDVHATILHQLGLDSRQLEIPGRKRLEIDHGKPIHEIINS